MNDNNVKSDIFITSRKVFLSWLRRNHQDVYWLTFKLYVIVIKQQLPRKVFYSIHTNINILNDEHSKKKQSLEKKVKKTPRLNEFGSMTARKDDKSNGIYNFP